MNNLEILLSGKLLKFQIEGEFSPEDVFSACNGYPNSDPQMIELSHKWAENIHLPSMHIDDEIKLYSNSGKLIAHWICNPVGWSSLYTKNEIERLLA